MPNKDDEARELAQKHYEVEVGLKAVFRLTGSADTECRPNEPIKLLEVNEYTVPSGIMPIHFSPAPASGFHYPSVIMEVTPAEFEDIRSHRLPLPHGWQIGEEIPKLPSTSDE